MKKLLIKILKGMLGRLDNHCREFFDYVDSGVVTKEYRDYGYKFFTQIVFHMNELTMKKAEASITLSAGAIAAMPRIKMPKNQGVGLSHIEDAAYYLSPQQMLRNRINEDGTHTLMHFPGENAIMSETQFNKAIREKEQMDAGKKAEQERMLNFTRKLNVIDGGLKKE